MARTETELTDEQMEAAYRRLTESTGTALRPIDLLGMARNPDTALDDRIDALTVVEYMRGLLDSAEHHLLDSARESGATWGALGAALGVSRQGAERRLLRGQTSLDGSRDADAGRKGRRVTGKQ